MASGSDLLIREMCKQCSISDSVSMVKFLLPESQSDISDSHLPIIEANDFCEIPFSLRASAILQAIIILSFMWRSVSSSMFDKMPESVDD